MQPFRTSLTARFVSASVAIALVGTGILALWGQPVLLPYVILLAICGCIVGLITGVLDHTWPVVALSVALPVTLWPYIMLSDLMIRRAPGWGWAFIAVGGLMAAQTAIASLVKPREAPLTASLQH